MTRHTVSVTWFLFTGRYLPLSWGHRVYVSPEAFVLLGSDFTLRSATEPDGRLHGLEMRLEDWR